MSRRWPDLRAGESVCWCVPPGCLRRQPQRLAGQRPSTRQAHWAVVFSFSHRMHSGWLAGGCVQARCLIVDSSLSDRWYFTEVRTWTGHRGEGSPRHRIRDPNLAMGGVRAESRTGGGSHSKRHASASLSSDATSCSAMTGLREAPSSKESPSGLAALGPFMHTLMGMLVFLTSLPRLSGP